MSFEKIKAEFASEPRVGFVEKTEFRRYCVATYIDGERLTLGDYDPEHTELAHLVGLIRTHLKYNTESRESLLSRTTERLGNLSAPDLRILLRTIDGMREREILE